MFIVDIHCLAIQGPQKEETDFSNQVQPMSLPFVKMPPTSLKSQVLWAQIQQPQGQQENEGITSALIIWAIEVASVEDRIQAAVYFHANPSHVCL